MKWNAVQIKSPFKFSNTVRVYAGVRQRKIWRSRSKGVYPFHKHKNRERCIVLQLLPFVSIGEVQRIKVILLLSPFLCKSHFHKYADPTNGYTFKAG